MAELKIKADSGGGTVSFKGPATTTSNAAVQLTLPVDDGAANQYLKTDGSGALSWATVDTSIADDSIAEVKLDVSNAPTDGHYLQYKDSSDKLTWDAAAKPFTYARTAAQLNGTNGLTVTGLDGSEIKELWFVGTELSNDSSSGNNSLFCQLGDSGGLETSGYIFTKATVGNSTGYSVGTSAWELGAGSGGSGDEDMVIFHMARSKADGTAWVCEWHHGQMQGGGGGNWMAVGIGTKVLSAELDRISFFWNNSHDFDKGYGQVFWLI